MENQYFADDGGVPAQPRFESSPPPPRSMPVWQSLSSSPMTIQTQDCFYNNNGGGLQFDSSALSSMVSSPAASNSNDNFVIRELIGKLGNIGGGASGEISPQHLYINSTNTSCYSTPMSSPPKAKATAATAALSSEFSADPGFAERAAKFSCIGSRSFNGRSSSSQFGTMNNNAEVMMMAQRSSNPLMMENGKLPRVSSSPSLKALLGSQLQMEVRTNSQDESTISEQNPNAAKPSPYVNSRKRKASSSRGKAKEASTSTPNSNANALMGAEAGEDSYAGRGGKNDERERNENGFAKGDEESKEGTTTSNEAPKPAEPLKDYIHVRARRGQATDSHSLAERVRREKIGERMKLLQDLVPGCNKVTGKALMLDEIINYVQSLQRQVEFLSMKLSSVNTRLDFSMESLISKDIFQSNNSLAHQIFQLDSSSPSYYGQQNSAIQNNNNNNIPNGNVTHNSVDPFLLNGFNNYNDEGSSQYPMTFSEDDLHAIVQMGFGQSANTKLQHSQSFNGNGLNQVPL